MKIPLRSSVSWVVAAPTVALVAGFWLTFGNEREYGTTYRSFVGLVDSFTSPSLPAARGAAPVPETATAPLAPPILKRAHAAGRGKAPRKDPAQVTASEPPARPAPPEPIDGGPKVPSPIEGIPQPAPVPPAPIAAPQELSADLIRDAFDAEPSKFPLDAKAVSERVVLRLVGLCRWQGRYIVKVAVGNQDGGDFFVKELAAYDGAEYVTVKGYFRLLVEPGRTREGYIVFSPRVGAQVKIKLKEDREKGRLIEVPVQYPF